MNRFIKKTEQKHILQKIYLRILCSTQKKVTTTPFSNKLSCKIKHEFFKCNINTTFKSMKNLLYLLQNCKPKTSILNANGVHRWDCDECNAVYVNQTGNQI